MLVGYGNYVVSWVIGGSASGAAFLAPDDGSALIDGRTGEVQVCRWIGGAQTTSSYVEFTGTVVSPLDPTTARIGVLGIANVIGLPAGTRLTSQAVNQNLVRGERRELSAWFLPGQDSNTVTFRIYNNVDGFALIPANAEFAIGEIFVGRVMQLPALVTGTNPSEDLQDPTQFNRSAGGQLRQLMRKPFRVLQRQLGPFTMAQAIGGEASDLPSGGSDTSSFIDLRALRSLLSTTALCAVCGAEGDPAGDSLTTANGIRYNQAFMQTNWMCARPSNIGSIVADKMPRWTWSPTFEEAT